MQKEILISMKNLKFEFLSVCCALILFLSVFAYTVSAVDINAFEQTDVDGKISNALLSQINMSPADSKHKVIILLKNQKLNFYNAEERFKIDQDQKNIVDYLNKQESSGKIQNIKSIKIINAIAVESTPDIINSLANDPKVSKVCVDQIFSIDKTQEIVPATIDQSITAQSNAWGVDKIGTPAVWKNGITGKGITIAVLDTGIEATHPDLDDLDNNPITNDPKLIGWKDFVNYQASPYDDHYHGTHVAGIIAGTGEAGLNTGVAPGANLIVAKVFSSEGWANSSDVILAMEWAVLNGANVISFSGAGPHDPEHDFQTVLDNVVAAGVIPVICAGNTGPNSSTMNCPGDEFNSTTVGATDSSDVVADFSSRGPVDLHNKQYIKPDISAPGVRIPSTVPSRYNFSYGYLDGTSMATPHVSGTVALMLERSPSLKPVVIKQILENTALDLGPVGKDNDYGSGRINTYDAVFFKQKQPVFPVANFTSNVSEGFVPLAVEFTDLSENATEIKWDFENDGITDSTDKKPVHVYTTTNVYDVNLTAINGNGTNSTHRKITVSERPSGFMNKVTLGDTSPVSPALASLNGRLYLAWKGNGNNNLNVIYSTDGGKTFGNKYTSSETSPDSPALCIHDGRLFIAWKGNGNNKLNVAQVKIDGDKITGFSNKAILGDTSPVSPSLSSLNSRLYLAWKGSGNNNLNVMYSTDGGKTFGNKYTSSETSSQSPVLCAHNGSLYISWKGNGNNNLNVAQVALKGNKITDFSNKVILGDTSPVSPSLATINGRLYLGWKGNGNNYLNVMYSTDNGKTFGDKYTSPERSPDSPALCEHNSHLYIAWKGDGNNNLYVAKVI